MNYIKSGNYNDIQALGINIRNGYEEKMRKAILKHIIYTFQFETRVIKHKHFLL